jgi:hypothetical protein
LEILFLYRSTQPSKPAALQVSWSVRSWQIGRIVAPSFTDRAAATG